MENFDNVENFDDLPDIDLNGVPDLPDFVNFPAGAIKSLLKMAFKTSKAKADKPAQRYIQCDFAWIEAVELTQEIEASKLPKPGDICTIRFFCWDTDKERATRAAGGFKRIAASVIERTGVSSTKEIVEACKDGIEGIGVFTNNDVTNDETGKTSTYVNCTKFDLT